jgi:hypothetical protein
LQSGAADGVDQPQKLTGNQLAKAFLLSPDTRLWLTDSRILVVSEPARFSRQIGSTPFSWNSVTMAVPRNTHGDDVPYWAELRMPNGTECSIKFSIAAQGLSGVLNAICD